MVIKKIGSSFVIAMLFVAEVNAQSSQKSIVGKKDTIEQKDVMDLADKLLKRKPVNKSDTARTVPDKMLLSVFPAVGYALQ